MTAHRTMHLGIPPRLAAKQAVRRTKKISNANICEPTIAQGATRRIVVDEFLAFIGGCAAQLVSHLIEPEQLILQDMEAARKALKKGSNRRASQTSG